MDADSSHPNPSDEPDYDATYSDALSFDFGSYVIAPESKDSDPRQETAQSDVP